MFSSTWSSLTRKPHSLGAVVPPGDHLGAPYQNLSIILCSGTQPFWYQRPVSWKIIFSYPGWGSWFWDDSSTLYLLCTLRQWQPTPVLLLGKSHGRRSLVGYSSPQDLKESDTTERLHFAYYYYYYIVI